MKHFRLINSLDLSSDCSVLQSLDEIIETFREHYALDNLITRETTVTHAIALTMSELEAEFRDICSIFNALRVHDTYTFVDSEVFSITYTRID
jgi:hypothetical protein